MERGGGTPGHTGKCSLSSLAWPPLGQLLSQTHPAGYSSGSSGQLLLPLRRDTSALRSSQTRAPGPCHPAAETQSLKGSPEARANRAPQKHSLHWAGLPRPLASPAQGPASLWERSRQGGRPQSLTWKSCLREKRERLSSGPLERYSFSGEDRWVSLGNRAHLAHTPNHPQHLKRARATVTGIPSPCGLIMGSLPPKSQLRVQHFPN